MPFLVSLTFSLLISFSSSLLVAKMIFFLSQTMRETIILRFARDNVNRMISEVINNFEIEVDFQKPTYL